MRSSDFSLNTIRKGKNVRHILRTVGENGKARVQKYPEKATSFSKRKKETNTCGCPGACMYGHTYSKIIYQPGKVANPARGQLNRTIRKETNYLRDSSRVPRRRPFINLKQPYAIGPVQSLSGHAIAYRWRSLPRVRRHRASRPQGSSEQVLP